MAKKPATYKGKSLKLGGGGQFAKLKDTVAAGYEKKGMSAAKAKAIGGAVAAEKGIKKYGEPKMNKMAVAGKKTCNEKIIL